MRRATHSHIRHINSLSRTLQSSPFSSSSFFFRLYNKILWDFHFISNIYLYVSIKLSFFVFPTIYPSMYLSDGVSYPILSISGLAAYEWMCIRIWIYWIWKSVFYCFSSLHRKCFPSRPVIRFHTSRSWIFHFTMNTSAV